MKIKSIFFFAILIFFSAVHVNGQNGSIKGIVTDKKTNETIIGANIFFIETQIGTSTNLEGEYDIKNIKPGYYNIRVSFISYKNNTYNNVKIEANKTTTLNISLEEEIITMNQVTIQAIRKNNTEVSIINSIKNSNSVVSGVSSQQISKTADKDASEVVRRIPGITIIDDRFIVVRGLSERYNTVLLNGATTPSSESDVKAFSFDVIPSNAIDRIMVYKTPSPELPADFAGANIQIFSKNIQDENSFSLSYNAGFKASTTAKTFHKYIGGANDLLGFDDGTRDIPSIMPSTNDFQDIINNPTPENKQLRTDIGRSFNKTWDSYADKAPIDQSASLLFARNFKVKKLTISNLSSISYSNSYKYSENNITSYLDYDTINDLSVISYNFLDKIYSQSVSMSGLMNWSVVYKNSSIEFKNLLNQQGTSKTTIREGIENYRSQNLKSTELSYNERTLYSGQINGNHKFFQENTTIKWTYGYSLALRKQPDTRRLTKILSFDQDEESPYYNVYSYYFPNRADPELAGRLFSDMNEKLSVYSIDITQKLNVLKNFQPIIKAGTYIESKDREFNSRLFGFVRNSSTPWNIGYKTIDEIFADTNINAKKGIKIDESTNPNDSYTANTMIKAGYASLIFNPIKKLTISGGIRIEKHILTLISTNANFTEFKKEIDTTNIFPSLNISYQLNEKNLIRFAYGKTINRPEFREIAPYIFYNFEEKAGIYGNPELKSSYIQNYDFRFEAYPSANEMINIGVFYKKFHNPIEAIAINAGSGKNFSFDNTETAESFGAELDIRKSIKYINPSNKYFRWINDISLVLNGSLIKSTVTVNDPLAIEKTRSMQGQSPYIVNMGVFYQNDSAKFSITILYNVIGKRIAYVGTILDPHIYEMPRNLLDVSISKKFGKHLSFKFNIKDIFNQPIVFQQENNVFLSSSPTELSKRIQETKSTIPGRQFSFGITYQF